MNTRQLDRNRISANLKRFEFRELFIDELGWDRADELFEISLEDQKFVLEAVAEKRGFRVYSIEIESDRHFPSQSIRKSIEIQLSNLVHEHIVIFACKSSGKQVWQWLKRQKQGQRIQVRSHWYYSNQSGESLIQKLEHLYFNLDQEDEITLPTVVRGANRAFDTEKVTKKFYDEFNREHKVFLDSIKGISCTSDLEWYASIMLNRMMFIYFIQKRGFLDGDGDYLRNRLKQVRNQYGSNTFQNFYRNFLLRLFYEGIGQPKSERGDDFAHLFGDIPFLNGGLFDLHDLETQYRQIEIPDDAFEKIFKFFDKYDWHLDDRLLRNDNEINPDVIGYIFEKYINQKEKGAYYTGEDITGYISRNSIVPRILDLVENQCPRAFSSKSEVWELLSTNPDRYIFKANQRSEALPTEKHSETLARLNRYQELASRLTSGEVNSIDSLITYNLDLETFLSDAITGSSDTKLVWEFWNAANKVSILDPTCGSGAFLFSALTILEPIYVACVDAMRDLASSGTNSSESEQFLETLSAIESHANENYFILKTIVINNLYGVDIMEEAVEICKLRLFLKLVAQLQTIDQIEPLPDIDFNIRAGNALVGFASESETTRVAEGDLLGSEFAEKIKSNACEIRDEFLLHQQMQTDPRISALKMKEQKILLKSKLDNFRIELDTEFAKRQGIDFKELDAWKDMTHPFHWFVEHYDISTRGGFDVIIGNPPYIGRSKVEKQYDIVSHFKSKFPDIYAYIVVRSLNLLNCSGRIGMILPLSLTFGRQYQEVRSNLLQLCRINWFSSFDKDPQSLFSGVKFRHTIHLGVKKTDSKESAIAYSSRLYRCYPTARPHLFPTLTYCGFNFNELVTSVPKFGSEALWQGFGQLSSRRIDKQTQVHVVKHTNSFQLHFKDTGYNYLIFCRKKPPAQDRKGKSIDHPGFKTIFFSEEMARDIAFLFLNGKIMFSWWLVYGDAFHLIQDTIKEALSKLLKVTEQQANALLNYVPQLESEMSKHLITNQNIKRVSNYDLLKCRHITDKSDQMFLQFWGASNLWHEIELFCDQTIKLQN